MMNKTQLFLKKHSSTILTVVGASGVVVTAVLSVKATPKAMQLLETAKEEKGEDLTVIETVKAAWKPFIPPVVAGCSTIACIFGANHLSAKNQASLMSAYALLDSSYKEYRKQVDSVYGDKADNNVMHEIVKSRFNNEDRVSEEGKEWFFDNQSGRFYQSTFNEVKTAGETFIENINWRGYGCLNEYYDLLGIPAVDFGFQQGWSGLIETNDPYNCYEIDFKYELVEREDGTNLWIVDFSVPPAWDYIL